MIDAFAALTDWLEKNNFDPGKVKVIIESPQAHHIYAVLKMEFDDNRMVSEPSLNYNTILGIPYEIRRSK